jgi:hypothetical protein
VGTTITVTGSDWGATTVEIFWANDKGEYVLQGTAKVDDNRNFTFSFDAPSGKAGNHDIKVRPEGNTVAANARMGVRDPSGKAVEITDGCIGVQ